MVSKQLIVIVGAVAALCFLSVVFVGNPFVKHGRTGVTGRDADLLALERRIAKLVDEIDRVAADLRKNTTVSVPPSVAPTETKKSVPSKPSTKPAGKCKKITNFGVLTVALGPYYAFVFPFVASFEKHFFADDPCVNVTIIIWTDKVGSDRWTSLTKDARTHVLLTHRDLAPFPAASLHRFSAYLEQEPFLRTLDYLWHVDIDAEMIEPVGYEMLVDGMFAVAHADSYYYDGTEVTGRKPGGGLLTMADVGLVRPVPAKMFQQWNLFDNKVVSMGDPPYDHNHNAKIPIDKAKYYFFGGVWGGRSDLVLSAFATLVEWIRGDESHGYMPVVHDESYVNRYFAENPPARVLTCAYMNPVLYWTHPWLFKTFDESNAGHHMRMPHECTQHDAEYPIVFPNGWEWPCFDATEADRLWTPRVWNMFKCSKRPCPRKPGRELPETPPDCTFCNL